MPNKMSEHMSNNMSEYMFDQMPDSMPENMSDRMSKDMPRWGSHEVNTFFFSVAVTAQGWQLALGSC